MMEKKHYLDQCWNIFYSNLRNKLQWNLMELSHIFKQANAFRKVIWKMSGILPRPQWVEFCVVHLPLFYHHNYDSRLFAFQSKMWWDLIIRPPVCLKYPGNPASKRSKINPILHVDATWFGVIISFGYELSPVCRLAQWNTWGKL